MDIPGCGQGSLADFCDHDSERSAPIKCGKFLGQITYCEYPTNSSFPVNII
jgi:hypothetical protein